MSTIPPHALIFNCQLRHGACLPLSKSILNRFFGRVPHALIFTCHSTGATAPRVKRNRSHSRQKPTLLPSRASPFATSLLIPLLGLHMPIFTCHLLTRSVSTPLRNDTQSFLSWIIASHLQVVHYILLSQNGRSLFRCYFGLGSLRSPSPYAKSARQTAKYFIQLSKYDNLTINTSSLQILFLILLLSFVTTVPN